MARRGEMGEPVGLHSGELFVEHIGLGPSIPTVYMERIFRRYLCPDHQGVSECCGSLRRALSNDRLASPFEALDGGFEIGFLLIACFPGLAIWHDE